MAKWITSKDFATLAGVSSTTISFVLNHFPGMRLPADTLMNHVNGAEAQPESQTSPLLKTEGSVRESGIAFLNPRHDSGRNAVY